MDSCRARAVEAIKSSWLPALLGGSIGGLVVGAFFVWPTVYGAKWWEVFTALGTVGAVFAAVFINIFQQKQKKNIRVRQAEIKRVSLFLRLGVLVEKIEKCNDQAGGTDFLDSCSRATLGEKILQLWECSTINESDLISYAEIDIDGAKCIAELLGWLKAKRIKLNNPTVATPEHGAAWVADFYGVSVDNKQRVCVANKMNKYKDEIEKMITKSSPH